MIYHVTTATVNTGKFNLMNEWAQKVTAGIKDRHGKEVTVLRNVAGSGDDWHFLSIHDSLAALEIYLDTISSDPQFQTDVGEAIEQDLWQSTRTNMYRTAF